MRKDLTGKVFHWLTVIGESGKKGRNYIWRCRCKCGKEVIRTTSHLNENVKHSCGCRGRERHHQTGSHFYRKYQDAKKRCNNKNVDSYKYYGGKGIKFEWDNFNDFKNDMYESYLEHVKEYGEENTSIDRIDSTKNYCKENCRRATTKEQNLNRSNMREVNGKKVSLAAISRDLGISYRTLSKRVREGVSVEDAIKLGKK